MGLILVKCRSIDEFIELISKKKIYIYGIGYVASNFLVGLKRYGLEGHIQGFVVSQKQDKQEKFAGFFVKQIDQIAKDKQMLICIAVHEVYREDIESLLFEKGFSNYIWIYPFLYGLYFGKPIRENQWIDLKKIISGYENQYGIAIRWAVIEEYYKKRCNGVYLYKKAMEIHTNSVTAEARVQKFIKLIQNWDAFGYKEDCQIETNMKYEVIDGEHRVALALYHGETQIKCKVYNGKNIHGESTLMTRKILIENGFSPKEVRELNQINQHIQSIIFRLEGENKTC